jgi:hypothetical protein
MTETNQKRASCCQKGDGGQALAKTDGHLICLIKTAANKKTELGSK